MEWEAIGAFGEIVGAAAVVLSLFYLGFQIRGQNKEARNAAMHETVAAQRDSMRMLTEPQLSEDYLAVIEDYDGATPAQRLRFTMAVMVIFKTTQDAYQQFLQGRLDAALFHPFGTQMADFMAYQSVQRVWELRKHQFDTQFRSYVDEMKIGTQLYV